MVIWNGMICVLIYLLHNSIATMPQPEKEKEEFKKILVKKYMTYKKELPINSTFKIKRTKKKINVNDIIKNITESSIIDDLIEKMTRKVLSRLMKRWRLDTLADIENKRKEIKEKEPLEQIEVLFDSKKNTRQRLINGKLY